MASTGGWESSKLKDRALVLGRGRAGPKPRAPYGGISVITDPTNLVVRYVLLLANDARMPAARDVRPPMESALRKFKEWYQIV